MNIEEEKLNILLRINDVGQNVSSNRTVGSKKDIIRLCFMSLIKNIKEYGENKINFQVYYDDISDEMLSIIKENVKENNIHKVIRNSEYSISMSTFNEIFQEGRTLDGPVLLLEDDYYFYPHSIEKLMNFYYQQKSIEEHFCINIMEDFNLSINDKDVFLFEVDDIKWRKISHTTLTIFTDAFILNKYEKKYMDHIKYFQKSVLPETGKLVTEENTVNEVYNEINCYAPTPSLTEHMQNLTTLSRNSVFRRIYNGESIYGINKNIWEK